MSECWGGGGDEAEFVHDINSDDAEATKEDDSADDDEDEFPRKLAFGWHD